MVPSDRTRVPEHTLERRRCCCLSIRKDFAVRVTEPGEDMESPSLEIHKSYLDMVQSNRLEVAPLEQGG